MNENQTRFAPSAICANCRRRLIPNEQRDGDGNVLTYTYEHPRQLAGVDCTKVEPLLFDGEDRAPDQVSVCDFCGIPGVSWDYPAEAFMCPGDPIFMFSGAWTACDACHADIEVERWGTMALRQCQVFGMDPIPSALTHFVNIFTAFAKNRTGPAVQA